MRRSFDLSQSPQTGQVYFNGTAQLSNEGWYLCLNPLKRVKFISIISIKMNLLVLILVSIPSNGSSLFQLKNKKSGRHNYICALSQSPQTGQVYFNRVFATESSEEKPSLNPLKRVKFISIQLWVYPRRRIVSKSQSPQTGQVYFNTLQVLINK